MRRNSITFTLFTLFLGVNIFSQDLTLTYAGNMGVILEDAYAQVIIDALHSKYKEDYQYPSKAVLDGIFSVKEKKERYLLVTHNHQDHVDAKLISSYLESNGNAKVYLPTELRSSSGNNASLTSDKVKIQEISLGHANPAKFSSLDHKMFLIEMGGMKIVHLGDADWLPENQETIEKAFKQVKIDMAIVPFWMAMDGRTIDLIKNHIRPSKLILGHISPIRDWLKEEEVLKHFPGAIFLKEVGKEIRF